MNDSLPINLERCDIPNTVELPTTRTIAVVPKPTGGTLSEKQLVDYTEQRKRFLSWLLNRGKRPERAEGYSPYTVYSDASRTARFDRWMWEERGSYQYPPEEKDAHAYLDYLARAEKGRVEKGKLQEGLDHLSKWLHYEHGRPEWEFDVYFPSSGGTLEPQDYLSKDERREIRQAALNRGSIPAYDTLSSAEKAGWKHYVARVLEKQFEEVAAADWEQVDGWEITSLVWTSLDAGLRPDEVANATPQWVDTDNGVLRIPYQESSKNEGNWTVSLTDRTTEALRRWKIEREQHHRFEDSDHLWLTSHGNPWGSQSLRRLLRRLCDQAGIETANRKMSWYTIRHSVGTYMTDERDLKAAKDQLRHRDAKTTMKYDQVSVEQRREALDRMG